MLGAALLEEKAHEGLNPLLYELLLLLYLLSVVEGCVYIRRRYYGILLRVGGEFELSALSPLSLRSLSDLSLALSYNATTLNHLIRLRGSQGIQIWKQRTMWAQQHIKNKCGKKEFTRCVMFHIYGVCTSKYHTFVQ